MLRNVKLKNFLIKNVCPLFSAVNKIFPKTKNHILIYCSNDILKDNAGAIYDYLVKNEYYKKYKITCCVQNPKSYEKPLSNNVKFLPKQLGFFIYLVSTFVFYSSGKIPVKPTEKQKVIFLTHGIPLKKDLGAIDDRFFTYMLISSDFFKEKISEAQNCPLNKIYICGEPKTDRMFLAKENKGRKKLIIWTPTFRQSDYLGYNDSHLSSFLPFIGNCDWGNFNEFLISENVKIIVKLHPAQTLNGFTEAIFSNLEIYSDKVFRKIGMELYELLGRSNALIADYSSVYVEYLLLDKPIGFALEDYEDYVKTRGFVLEDQIEYMPGKKLYSCDDLYEYIDDIACEKDTYSVERQEMLNLFHHYKDGHNAERVLNIAGITM